MTKRPEWYGKTGKPYLGYWSESEGISPHLENADENSIIFPCVEMHQIWFGRICGDNTSLSRKPVYWEFFPGVKDEKGNFKYGGEMYWRTLMASTNSEPLYLVTDDFKDVYIFHVAVQMTYHLGRLKRDWAFTKYVLRKLRQVRLEEPVCSH
jgi:hypothetical protein